MEDPKSKSFPRAIAIRKSKGAKSRIPIVSSPTDFRHILHVGSDSHHIDVSSVPPEWQDVLEIAKHCQELDISSNSSTESDACKKDKAAEKVATEEIESQPEGIAAEMEQSDIDLFAELEQSLCDDYKKFLFG